MYVYKDVKWHQENYVTVKNVRNLKEKGKTLVPGRAFCILVKDIYMGTRSGETPMSSLVMK